MYPPELGWVDADNISIDTVMIADVTAAQGSYLPKPAEKPGGINHNATLTIFVRSEILCNACVALLGND